jgi:hypothetical protein
MLVWLESTALSVWIKEGQQSIWSYPTILTLHTFALMVLVGASVVVDLRLLGVARSIPLAPLQPLFRWMWAAFALSALTGGLLFMADATLRGTSLLFGVKLGLVALGVATLVLIKKQLYGPDAPANGVSRAARRLAMVSLVVWTLAITAGRLLAYFA